MIFGNDTKVVLSHYNMAAIDYVRIGCGFCFKKE
jgi:hypothetical protein